MRLPAIGHSVMAAFKRPPTSVVIEGSVTGTIRAAGKVLVAPTGKVHSQVRADVVEVQGVVAGALEARDLVIDRTGFVQGTVHYANLRLKKGGRLSPEATRSVEALWPNATRGAAPPAPGEISCPWQAESTAPPTVAADPSPREPSKEVVLPPTNLPARQPQPVTTYDRRGETRRAESGPRFEHSF